MKQAFYRNYRPRKLGEVLGQDHVTKTLQRALKSGRISHAYLFTGPRGVGKTSTARILAHEVNQFKYDGEATHLDIIEIDAASNRRIDEIRDLRDKIRTAPAVGKYKVYIIDEVHMLTREAFNALLKTLEEPPAHIIFILATTEAHKLPETIISRTQRFEFKPISAAQTAKHLQAIAKNEKIDIEKGAVELLAEFGGGSFRDSISLLDQLATTDNKITEQDVRLVLGLPSAESVEQLLNAISTGQMNVIIETIQNLKEHGVDAAAAAAELSKKLRSEMVKKSDLPFASNLLRQLLDVPASGRPYDYLEISLLEAASGMAGTATAAPVIHATKQPAGDAKDKIVNIEAAIPAKSVVKAGATMDLDISTWPQIVDSARQKAASIYTALRLAQPEIAGDALVLKFEFPLHRKKLEQAKNKDMVAALIEELTGKTVRIECVVDKAAFKKPRISPEPVRQHQQPASPPLSPIHSIFGAAEVVET
jgi:DNA polymerase-3 subunit gamma/tau